jgi:tRNA nucleotidyltransferase/poly(A) polymerase
MNNGIYEAVAAIISPVYLVGGSVRDVLLEREPKDYDFTTSLPPDEIEARIKAAGRHCNPRGKRFGTLGFKVAGNDGKFVEVEVTTFRKEKYAIGSRKPDVQFIDNLHDDLARRDFTINAIAYDGKDYIDPFGGRLHILSKDIKSVGEATDRFKEDPLRMLRAARLAAQLEFLVDPNMIGKIRKMADKILDISRERWVQELDKLLVQENPELGLDMLRTSHLLKYMLPEINLLDTSAYEAMIEEIKATPKEADERWAAMLAHSGKGFTYVSDVSDENYGRYKGNEKIAVEVARGMGSRLKSSNKRMDLIADRLGDKINRSPSVEKKKAPRFFGA